jgi:hypothetical protein
MKGIVEDSYREKLPDDFKRAWDTLVRDVNKISIEMKLTATQKEALLQRAKATVINEYLKVEAKKLPKDSEAYKENKSMRDHMAYVYRKYYAPIENIYEDVNTRLGQLQQERNQKNTKRSTK